MFPHAKLRVFIRLRMVFIKTSAHFRPQANGSPNTLARRAERRYMESPFRCPTLPQTGLATAKTTASAHGLPFPCTDATEKRIFSEFWVEIRMICFIFTDTSCISGEMREREPKRRLCAKDKLYEKDVPSMPFRRRRSLVP